MTGIKRVDRTKEKILRAASRLFSEKGLDDVTVREICRAAKVNVALVNYHFGNKDGLYRECVERIYLEAHGAEMSAVVAGICDTHTWEAAVRKWIGLFVAAFHTKAGVGAFASGIFRQEAMHPSKMQPYLDEHFAKPARNRLFSLMRMATENDQEAYLWAASIWVQIGAYALYNPVWRKYHRPPGFTESEWRRDFVAFVCERIFRELKFRGTAV